MTLKCLETYPQSNKVIVFANTGQEHPETYAFIKNFISKYNVNIKTVEIDLENKYKLVSFNTMKRDGSLFEKMVQKYGIPNQGFPHCTRELKTRPMKAFVRDYFGTTKYHTAIGIRSDEVDRIPENYRKMRYIYPLADLGITKKDIDTFWDNQSFKLNIPNYLGNCVWCWKKTMSKHKAIALEYPHWYDVPRFLEKKYRINKIESQKKRYGNVQTFFRKRLSALDILKGVKIEKDEGFNSCQESCEAFN